MRNFTLRKGFLESKCGTCSSFKGFVMLVVMLIMTASSAMAQEAKFEVIGVGFAICWILVLRQQLLCLKLIVNIPVI